jgi:hypothetical protein
MLLLFQPIVAGCVDCQADVVSTCFGSERGFQIQEI